MKILHTSDLHIGKRINEYSMLEEQEHILEQIIGIAKEEQTDAVILAGDIYDKNVPSAEAVCLFDKFLVNLVQQGIAIFIISGNHDSAERIAFGSEIMKSSKVYLSPVYNGKTEPIILNDGKTEAAFYLLPFIKPSTVRYFAEEETELKSYNEAMQYVIKHLDINKERTNILITHQFITGSTTSESEECIVGGLDNIDAVLFEDFDYVALGHLHRPQFCGRETVRYSGTPLKYSFSEANDRKSVTIVEINGKNAPVISERPLVPKHEWFDLKGSYNQLVEKSYYDGKGYQEAFVRITLTDEDDIPDGMRKLKSIYHRLMELHYDNKRTRAGITLIGSRKNVNAIKPDEVFCELFEKQNAQPMSEEQKNYLNKIIDIIFNGQ